MLIFAFEVFVSWLRRLVAKLPTAEAGFVFHVIPCESGTKGGLSSVIVFPLMLSSGRHPHFPVTRRTKGRRLESPLQGGTVSVTVHLWMEKYLSVFPSLNFYVL